MNNICPPQHYGSDERCRDRNCNLFLVSRSTMENIQPMLSRSNYAAAGHSGFGLPPRFNLSATPASGSRLPELQPRFNPSAMVHPMLQFSPNLDDGLSQDGTSEQLNSHLSNSCRGSTIGYARAKTPEEDGNAFENVSAATQNTSSNWDSRMWPGDPPSFLKQNSTYRQAGDLGAFQQPHKMMNAATTVENNVKATSDAFKEFANNEKMRLRQSLEARQKNNQQQVWTPPTTRWTNSMTPAGGMYSYDMTTPQTTRDRAWTKSPPVPSEKLSRDDIDFLRGSIDRRLTMENQSRAENILDRLYGDVPDSSGDSVVAVNLTKMLQRFEDLTASSVSTHTDLVNALTKRMESLEKSIIPVVDHRMGLLQAEASLRGNEYQVSNAPCGGPPAAESSPFLRPIKNRDSIRITDQDGNPVEFGTAKKV